MCSQTTNISHLGRPATALQRVLDKVGISFPNLNSTTTTTTTTTLNSQKDSNSNHKTTVSMTAHKLYKKIGRLIKYKNKVKDIEQNITNDFYNWTNNFPNLDNQQLVREFSQLILLQSKTTAQMNEKLDRIKLSLSFVNEREKKRIDLINTKFKLEKQLRDVQAKFGPKASQSILISEKLEEVESALQTVQSQYDGCIATDLRETIVDFAFSLYSISKKLSDAAEEFAINLDQESGEMLARLSPNKYSKAKRNDSKLSNDQHVYELGTPQSLGFEDKKLTSYNIYNEGQSSQQQHHQQQQQQQQQRNITQSNILRQSQNKQNISTRHNSESEPLQYPFSNQKSNNRVIENINGGTFFPKEMPEEFNDHWGNN